MNNDSQCNEFDEKPATICFHEIGWVTVQFDGGILQLLPEEFEKLLHRGSGVLDHRAAFKRTGSFVATSANRLVSAHQ
jgi:hypothetical protein